MSADNKPDIQENSLQPASPVRVRTPWYRNVSNLVRGVTGGALLMSAAACATPNQEAQASQSPQSPSASPASLLGNESAKPDSVTLEVSPTAVAESGANLKTQIPTPEITPTVAPTATRSPESPSPSVSASADKSEAAQPAQNPDIKPSASASSPEAAKSAAPSVEAKKFPDQGKYIQHITAISNSHISNTVYPGFTREDAYFSRMGIVGPPNILADGSKVYMFRGGNGSEVITKNNIVVLHAFTPLKGQEPTLQTVENDFGKPNYMKQGVSDPSLKLGPAGAFAFWNDPFGGGFAVMIDTNTNKVQEFILVNDSTNNMNYDHTRFENEWGKSFLASN